MWYLGHALGGDLTLTLGAKEHTAACQLVTLDNATAAGAQTGLTGTAIDLVSRLGPPPLAVEIPVRGDR